MSKTNAVVIVLAILIVVPSLARCQIESDKSIQQTIQVCIKSGGQWSRSWGGYCDKGYD